MPWTFKFLLKCQDREYHLYSASEDERTLWVFTFYWIIKESLRLKSRKDEKEKARDMFRKLPVKIMTKIIQKSQLANKLQQIS